VDLGVFLPVSGRSATAATLTDAALRAEEWGFSTVWAADRVVNPWKIETPYPYADSDAFIVPPDRPFLECLTVLSFLAAATSRIRLGSSVVVMNFRHPLHWFKQATSIDRLSEGRLVLGVGIGWMEEEFAAMGAPFPDRGRVADEQLEIIHTLLGEERASYRGDFYAFDDVAFEPKAHGARLPIWVGGEGRRAQRRAAHYSDAWFPYFVRVTSDELVERFGYVREQAVMHERDPDEVALACCLPVEITDKEVAQEPDRLRGTPQQVAEALARFSEVGVTHVGLQFMAPRYPERMEQIERFALESDLLDAQP
jgi:probable F420-dependent oxidoreductase